MLLLVSTVLLYPASLPPLFQKLGFGVLAMTLFDSHNADLGRDHPWRLAWSGVLGCLIPLPICMIALPGVPPSLAHSAATKQLNLLAEACAAHHYAMVCRGPATRSQTQRLERWLLHPNPLTEGVHLSQPRSARSICSRRENVRATTTRHCAAISHEHLIG
jgi:hypothetical protein